MHESLKVPIQNHKHKTIFVNVVVKNQNAGKLGGSSVEAQEGCLADIMLS